MECHERSLRGLRTDSKAIQNQGFSSRIETVNAVEAWRGSLPGDGYRNVLRVVLHTFLADLLRITSVWAGLRENPSALMPEGSPPLLYAATTGATPFRFNLHVNDLGHTMIVGSSGARKSTLIGLVSAQWFRYACCRALGRYCGSPIIDLRKRVMLQCVYTGDGGRRVVEWRRSFLRPTPL